MVKGKLGDDAGFGASFGDPRNRVEQLIAAQVVKHADIHVRSTWIGLRCRQNGLKYLFVLAFDASGVLTDVGFSDISKLLEAEQTRPAAGPF